MEPTAGRIRIVLADDHRIVARALELVLQDCFEVVATVGDGLELVESVSRLRPDIVLTDLAMPRMDGLAAIRALRALGPQPRIIVLSMHADAARIAAARDAGASGYVLKEAAGAEVRAAIVAVHAGGSYWPQAFREPSRPDYELTPRQSQVLELTARGYGMKRIADALRISPRTVESHKYQMMEALGARTTAELVHHAIRLGLLEVGGAPVPAGAAPVPAGMGGAPAGTVTAPVGDPFRRGRPARARTRLSA